MSKKILILMCVFIILMLSITGCATNKNIKSQDNVINLNYKASVNVSDTKDLNVIANKLFTEYLNYYTKDTVKNDLKLKNYKINQITIKDKNDLYFKFMVDFSVEPYNLKTWLTPNGAESNNWIDNKVLFIKASINKDVYTIEEKATSP